MALFLVTSPTSGSLMEESLRQHAICSQLAERDFNAWHATASLKAKQRIQSASATNAGSWLTTFPTTPELTMADEFFAVKHRVGLRPIADLPAKCTRGAKLSDDSQHFYSCGQLKRKAMTVRHCIFSSVRIWASGIKRMMASEAAERAQKYAGTDTAAPDLMG